MGELLKEAAETGSLTEVVIPEKLHGESAADVVRPEDITRTLRELLDGGHLDY